MEKRPVKLRVNLNGRIVEAEVVVTGKEIRLDTGGRAVVGRLCEAGHDEFILESGHGKFRMVGLKQGKRRALWVDGKTLHYEIVTGASKDAASNEGGLAALIPAVVKTIHVQPGQDVRRGDRLVTLESMKMVMHIVAPRDGQIQAILCQLGQAVEAGIPLLEIKPG